MGYNLKIISNDMLPIYETPEGEKIVDGRELHETLLVRKDFTSWIKNRIDKYGFIRDEDYHLTLTKTGERSNVTKHDYLLTMDTAKEIAMVENNEQGRAVRKHFIKVEKYFRQNQQPQSIEDLIIMQAQSLKTVRQEQEALKLENQTFKHRLDNIDRVDAIGDLQQRLNRMIKKLARQEGIPFGKAWSEFRTSYNTAYRTNLTTKINNYKEKHGLKSLTMPQYLSISGQLEDAIRVADKLLN